MLNIISPRVGNLSTPVGLSASFLAVPSGPFGAVQLRPCPAWGAHGLSAAALAAQRLWQPEPVHQELPGRFGGGFFGVSIVMGN